MTFSFRPAVRENVGLWINVIGGTGSGKSFSSLRLASGIANGKRFAFIDTENRRGLHYADQFDFDYAEITAPFRPEKFIEAVEAADKQGYPVIVIDSGSAVWAGDGGILDWQEEELDRMAGSDYSKRERVKMAAWIKPKMSHKHLVQKLLQVRAHIILSLRAEQKIEMVKGQNGKLEIRQRESLTGKDGWIPVAEKNLPFEATCSFLLTADNPGIPHPIKLQEQHKMIFPLDKPISEESGRLLAEWASGGKAATPRDAFIDRRDKSVKYFVDMGVDESRILRTLKCESVDDIKESDVDTLKKLATDIKAGEKSLLDAFPVDEANEERAAIEAE